MATGRGLGLGFRGSVLREAKGHVCVEKGKGERGRAS